MSGTLISMYENVSYALRSHGKAIMLLQEQAATGNRINRASDDPADAYRVLGLNSQDRSLNSYKDAVIGLMGMLEISSTVLADMTTQLADARTSLTQIVGGIYDVESQKRLAEHLNDTLEHLVSLANTKHANQYLFGGDSSAAVPYRVEREGGLIVGVTYEGSDETRRMDVAPGLDVETFHVGDDIFRSGDREDSVFLGGTGAAGGTGTSSVRGDVWLTVENDGTSYRISIDDGATFVTVPAGGAANQAVTDSRTGRVLYVDTTGINSTGVELVRVPGTYDVFGTLISLRDMLLNDRGLPEGELIRYVDQCVAAVEEARERVVQADVSTGSRIGFLDTLKHNLENMQFDTQDEATRLVEADITQIAVDLSQREVLYQMSLSVAGKLMSTTLLDFLR